MALANSILYSSAVSLTPAKSALTKTLYVSPVLAPLKNFATLTPLLAPLTKKHPGGYPTTISFL